MKKKRQPTPSPKKVTMPSGHARLKKALVLRDALAAEVGLPLDKVMDTLRHVEDNSGIRYALQEGRYRDAMLSLCNKGRDHIAELDDQVGRACARAQLSPRYAQYVALILFAHWLHAKTDDESAFLARLNNYLAAHPCDGLTPFVESDLQLAAFWMATAAGKTHVLHACLALLERHRHWNRIILITPSESLTLQHADKLRAIGQWSVFAYPQSGDASALKYQPSDTVLVLDINKLAKSKQGDGVTLSARWFEGGRNLVFVDEGHKGQKNQGSVWKDIQQTIAGIDAQSSPADRGLLVEFSATFGQVVDAEHSFTRYAKSIIFDYAYDRFHRDLYGKDFWHVRASADQAAANVIRDQTLTAALLTYWYQLRCFRAVEKRPLAERSGLQVVAPLWVLLGLSVIGSASNDDNKAQTSDVINVIQFFANAFDRPAEVLNAIRQLVQTTPGQNTVGLLPPDVLSAIQSQAQGDTLAEEIFSECFDWRRGDQFVLRLIKSATGEMGLGLLRGDTAHYFGVVNVGDAAGLIKQLKGDPRLHVDEDVLQESLFAALDKPNSRVNVLIGSRRFAEGWDNYRASSLTLLRLGQGEGSLIIQMFGRVVRFAGINGNGKRLAAPPKELAPLQTAYVYGLRSTYLDAFLKALTENGVTPTVSRICPTQRPDSASHLRTVKAVLEVPNEFRVELIDRGGASWHRGLGSVAISLSASVTTARMAGGNITMQAGMMGQDLTDQFRQWVPYLDVDAVYLELLEWRRSRRLWNLVFDCQSVRQALTQGKYQVIGLPGVMQVRDADDLARLNRLAMTIVRKIFEQAYRRQQKHRVGLSNLSAEPATYRHEQPLQDANHA